MRNLLFLGLLLLSGCVIHRSHYSSFKPKPPHSIRVASYNLYWNNGSCDESKPNSSTQLLRHIDADIVLIQEMSPHLAQCLSQFEQKRYKHTKFRMYKKEGGLGVLSKYPFKTLNYILPKHGRFPAWLIAVKTPHGNIELLNVHLQPQVNKNDGIGMFGKALFNSTAIRKREIRQFAEYIDPKVPTIVAGDFNEESSGGAVRFLCNHGFHDVLKHTHEHTWEHKVGPITLAKRFDRILSTQHFCLKQIQVLHESTSDHFPVIADFNFYSR